MEESSSRKYLYVFAVLLVAGLGWLMWRGGGAPAPANNNTTQTNNSAQPAGSVSTNRTRTSTGSKVALNVISPFSGDVWHRGVAYVVQWNGINRNIPSVTLQLLSRPLSDTTPSVVWQAQAPNNGNYKLVLPEAFVNGTYRWLVTQGDTSAYSSYFDIR